MIYTVTLTRTFEQEITVCANSADEARYIADTILNRTNLLDVTTTEETEEHFTTAIKSDLKDGTGSLHRLENCSDDDYFDDDDSDDEDYLDYESEAKLMDDLIRTIFTKEYLDARQNRRTRITQTPEGE